MSNRLRNKLVPKVSNIYIYFLAKQTNTNTIFWWCSVFCSVKGGRTMMAAFEGLIRIFFPTLLLKGTLLWHTETCATFLQRVGPIHFPSKTNTFIKLTEKGRKRWKRKFLIMKAFEIDDARRGKRIKA